MQHGIYSLNLVALYERREKKRSSGGAMLIDGEKEQLWFRDKDFEIISFLTFFVGTQIVKSELKQLHQKTL